MFEKKSFVNIHEKKNKCCNDFSGIISSSCLIPVKVWDQYDESANEEDFPKLCESPSNEDNLDFLDV